MSSFPFFVGLLSCHGFFLFSNDQDRPTVGGVDGAIDACKALDRFLMDGWMDDGGREEGSAFMLCWRKDG